MRKIAHLVLAPFQPVFSSPWPLSFSSSSDGNTIYPKSHDLQAPPCVSYTLALPSAPSSAAVAATIRNPPIIHLSAAAHNLFSTASQAWLLMILRIPSAQTDRLQPGSTALLNTILSVRAVQTPASSGCNRFAPASVCQVICQVICLLIGSPL